ncbi:MAG: response regulator [Proteobacteria bacterium]|nr:response regulator [Pseudomonadota bacterium]
MDMLIMKVAIRYEQDIVLARQKARQIAEQLGLDKIVQARISSAVSEIVRNAFQYASGGEAEFQIKSSRDSQAFIIRISDRGPGIENLNEVLDGKYKSQTGMGRGILGARRLMDDFLIEAAPGKGTVVTLIKTLPAKIPSLTGEMVSKIAEKLRSKEPENPFVEIQQQNQELVQTLHELQLKQEELERVNQELEDTNRGVLALYAEIDEKSNRIRSESEIRTQFFSGMSHELRTPINSILSLSRLLIDRTDGDLTKEQERQVFYIKTASESLSSLINDLLDLSKIQAGKITPNISDFTVTQVFSALRGMIKPLLGNTPVALVIEETEGIPLLNSDEGKLSQILRNLTSNAIKFTETGEVRISAHFAPDRGTVFFSVADTGIGIASEDIERIFEEYTQVSTKLQAKVKGTGLGLSLSKKLAEFLGGSMSVESMPGSGSKFSFEIPVDFSKKDKTEKEKKAVVEVDVTRKQVLVLEDNPATMLVYETYLRGSGFEVVQARTSKQATELLGSIKPLAIILDILLEKEVGWDFLQRLKMNPDTSDIPVIVVSVIDEKEKGVALGADDYCVKPVERDWLLKKLLSLSTRTGFEKILVIDDEDVARYLLRSHLANTKYTVIEASNGEEGIRLAREQQPDIIFLDLVMPGLSGFETLDRLKSIPETMDIPVIVNTSKILTGEEKAILEKNTSDILMKKTSSREEAIARVREALIRISEKKE